MSQRYEVQGKIGEGGLGEVYLARDTQLDREVALKRVRAPEDADMAQLETDLIREAKTLSALQHPNIVTIYDVGRDDKGPFVVMELLKGETLDQVADRGKLSVADFTEVVLQVMEGMVAAQSRGLVHRDLKPGNLMVNWLASGKFQVKILDFGLARFTRQAKPQTADQGDGIFGSIYFMAPEQFERLPLDARTDMYSLGCIFYQVLTQRHPFDGETAVDVMVSHLQHLVTPLHEIRSDVPRWMCDWIMWLVHREMEDRPEDARTALDAFVRQTLPHAPAETAASVARAVKVVGRGKGPGGTTQPVTSHGRTGSGKSTQQVRGGTTHSARSSRPAVRKVPKQDNRNSWIAIGVMSLAIAGVAWYKFWGPGSKFSKKPETAMEVLDRMSKNARPEGNAETVGQLLEISENGERAVEVGEVLERLQGDGVSGAIAKALNSARGPNRMALINAIAKRPSAEGMKALAEAAGNDTGETLKLSMKALAKSGDAGNVTALLAHTGKITEAEDRRHFMATTGTLLGREADPAARVKLIAPALSTAPAAALPGILALLEGVDHPSANDVLRDEIAAGGERQRAALEVLPGWAAADNQFLFALINMAEKKDKDLLAPLCARLSAQDRHGEAAAVVGLLKSVAPLCTSPKAKEAFTTALGTLGSDAALAYAREQNAASAVQEITRRMAGLASLAKSDTQLDSKSASIFSLQRDAYYSDTVRYISGWKLRSTRIAWDIRTDAAATVEVDIQQSLSEQEPRTVRVSLGPDSRVAKVQSTRSSEDFAVINAGRFSLPAAGTWRLWLEGVEVPPGGTIMNIRSVTLRHAR